jgi:(+)-pinoresinol hydroxylase
MRTRLLAFAACGAALLGGLGAFGGLAQLASAQGAPDLERGQAVYDYWCAPCHAPGPGHPGTQSLQVKYGDSLPAVLEDREDLTPEVVKVFVRQGVLSMPPFRKTEITDDELEALAAYLAQ